MSVENILSVRNITKTYPGVIALQNISMDFKKGEIHALVGENGAGKSTLIKVIAGAVSVDKGHVYFEGELQDIQEPLERRTLGIEVIYQEFNLIPELSIAENIFLGSYPGGLVCVNREKIVKDTQVLLDELGLGYLNPKSPVKNLSVAYMQMIEIAKAIARHAKFIIMDEPTAPLTANEVKILYSIVDKLKREGITILYISHRLEEVFDLADRVTVFRDGRKIETLNITDTCQDELIRLMVNRETSKTFPDRNYHNKDLFPLLEVNNLYGRGVRNVSFKLHKGEILGLGGLVGAGRTETAKIIFGANKMWKGSIFCEGKELHITSPRDAVQCGIAYVSEDRKQEGVLLTLSIKENIVLPILKKISMGLVVRSAMEDKIVEEQRSRLRIKTPSTEQLVKNLSGGNQQKVVLAKWLASDCKILILDEPTRGIDIGAKQEIYLLMNQLAESGIGIIMISSEMDELIGMSDRIIVLHEGKISGELQKGEFDQETILKYGSGYAVEEQK